MERSWKVSVCAAAVLLLAACGQAEPVVKEGLLPEAEEYWMVETEGGQVALRSGGEESLSLVWVKDGKETLLKTLEKETDYYEPKDVTAWTFTDTMGYDGFVLRTLAMGGFFGTNVYYVVEEGQLKQIADSFGFEVEDTAVDLNGDQQTELAPNNTFGGDGHRTGAVFQPTADGIEKGVLTLPEIPNHDNWGINSYMAEYDPIGKVFRITYSVRDQELTDSIETAGLEWFTFSPYEAG